MNIEPTYHFDLEQGSPRWHQLRLGRPTTSSFGKIITPDGKPSKQADDYRLQLLGERFALYKDEPQLSSFPIKRGQYLEQEAADYYESVTERSVKEVGFVTCLDEWVGCSPDRLVEDDGLLEIKCPMQKQHIVNLLSGTYDIKYKPQVQGQLWVTGRQWCDWVSYHPAIKPKIVRVERDEDYIATLEQLVIEFLAEYKKDRDTLVNQGVTKKEISEANITLAQTERERLVSNFLKPKNGYLSQVEPPFPLHNSEGLVLYYYKDLSEWLKIYQEGLSKAISPRHFIRHNKRIRAFAETQDSVKNFIHIVRLSEEGAVNGQ